MKKITAAVLSAILLLLLPACSQESKFGVDEFSKRLESDFDITLDTADLVLGNDKNGDTYFFAETAFGLIALFPDSNNNISGLSLLCEAGGDIQSATDLYCKVCCILTGSDMDTQRATLTNCGITADRIGFTSGSQINTVGKFKYVAVCNEYSVTLFCERV